MPTRTISPRPTRLLTPGWVPSLIPSSPLFAKQAAFKTTHVPAFRAALERGGPFLSSSHAHDSWAWVDDAFPSAVATFANAADDVSRRADALETALRGEGKKETETETEIETKHTRRGIMHKTNGFGRRDGLRLRRRARALVAAVAATRGPPSVVSVAEAYFARRLAEFAAKAECSLEEDEEGTDDVPDEANDDEETEDRETYATEKRDLENDGGGGGVSMDVDGDSSENVFGLSLIHI